MNTSNTFVMIVSYALIGLWTSFLIGYITFLVNAIINPEPEAHNQPLPELPDYLTFLTRTYREFFNHG